MRYLGRLVRLGLVSSLLSTGFASVTSGQETRDVRVVKVIVWGDYAADNLARTYHYLKARFPQVLLSSDPDDVVEQSQEIPWVVAVRREKWPNGAKQAALFMDTFRVAPGRYQFPDAQVRTEIAPDTVPLPADWSADLTAKQTDIICDKYGWQEIERAIDPKTEKKERHYDKCVKNIVPPRQGFGLSAKPGEVAIRRPAYVLTLNKPVPEDVAERIRKDLSRYLRDLNPEYALKVRVETQRPRPGPSSLVPQRGDGDAEPWWVTSCLPEVLARQRDLVRWRLSEALTTFAVIVDSSIRTRMGRVGSAVDAPLEHPYVTGAKEGDELKELPAECANIIPPSHVKAALGDHALAVASIVYGLTTKFARDPSPVVPAQGFLLPSQLSYVPGDDLRGPLEWPEVGVHTDIVTFDGDPVADDKTMNEAANYVAQIAKSGGVIVVSAPKKKGCDENLVEPEPATPDLGVFDYRAATGELQKVAVCPKWPACLGATPYVMVVAALDNDGKFLCQGQVSLGSAVVGLAAPAQKVLTAVPVTRGIVEFTVRSGSSFAAPAVAAVAMAMQSRKYGVRRFPLAILARIAATADFVLPSDKVRYGRLNAERALTGMDAGQETDVVWVPMPRPAIVEASKASVKACSGAKPRAELARVAKRTMGFLRLFEPEKSYPENRDDRRPECIELTRVLRITRSGTTDSRNNPLFTVVYYKETGARDPYPMIRRNVALQPTSPSERYGCSWRGDGADSCLFVKYADAPDFQPLDLSDADVVFSIDKAVTEAKCGTVCGVLK